MPAVLQIKLMTCSRLLFIWRWSRHRRQRLRTRQSIRRPQCLVVQRRQLEKKPATILLREVQSIKIRTVIIIIRGIACLMANSKRGWLFIIRRWIRRTILLPVDRFMLVIMRRTRRIITVFCCHQFCLIRLEAEPVVVVLGFKELKTPFRLVWTCTQMDLPTKMPVARTRWLVSVPRTQVVI